MRKKMFFVLGMTLWFFSCSENQIEEPVVIKEDNFIRAADISFLPLIESEGTLFYNANNQLENALLTLKRSGCNTIRIRLWKNPTVNQSTLSEVKALAQRVKNEGMKVWLCVHYSDTWADPGTQEIPSEWQNFNFFDLKTAVSDYTTLVVREIQPDIIQIGNEINSGFLWPEGNLITNESQFLQLLSTAILSVRNESPNTKVMLHYAGIGVDANWFYNKVRTVDYDYIGLSYYPIWHGKNLIDVESAITSLGQNFSKDVIIAETAYPFTLGYNDWTNNIIGTSDQIIANYPASPEGQKNYMMDLRAIIDGTANGIGFCYWGTEWVAFRGSQSTNGSPWENQSMWDFNNKALPVMEVFNP
jgi:arabinogalactan endo-1,4-beta-galactosidase